MPRSPDLLDAVVGRRIAARRAAMGLEQSALAQRLGIRPTATAEGRAVAAAFPLIADRGLRQALARITEALAPAP